MWFFHQQVQQGQSLYKTILKNRVLWWDGTTEVEPDKLHKWAHLHNVAVTHVDQDVEKYNQLVGSKIGLKESMTPFDVDFKIPDFYKELNIDDYLVEKISEIHTDDAITLSRVERYLHEMEVYKQLNLQDFLRTAIFISDQLKKQNVVYGLGRGSAVSSYILYLIGIHSIDSMKYDLSIHDFLKVK